MTRRAGSGGLARIGENLRLGARSLLRRPLRTLLVLQGIIWGVAVSVMPPAILEGSHQAARDRATTMGTDRISLRAQPASPRPWLDTGDLAAIRERFGPVLDAAGGYRTREARASGAHEAEVDLIGATGDVLAARGQTLAAGETLGAAVIEEGAAVALLEPGAARALFGDADPIGRTVDFPGSGTAALRVIGLVARRDDLALRTDDLGLDLDHPLAAWVRNAMGSWGLRPADDSWKRADRGVIVPLRVVPGKPEDALDWVLLRTGPDRAPAESMEVERFLGERGRDVEVSINLVWPLLVGGHLDRYLALNRALFLACLVMGGVVIANLMILSTLERRREIAIRRTEGATRRDVVVQFLTEAVLMGIVGSVLGVPLGLGLAKIRVALEPVSVIVVVVPWRAVLVSVTMAVTTAAVAGVFPAVRAARVDPVEAMRCE